MSPLLQVAKIAITQLSLGLSPLGQLIYKKSVAVVVLEESA